MERRPDPTELLEYVKKVERQESSGKLKIFLGAAPGVGKTYAMLEDAVAKKYAGIDVVAGIIETHGRKEIEAFLNKLDILPRKVIPYHGKTIQEFDLDAALIRQPQLLLVDEIAHTNAPGSRHPKRWQDIIELLDKGIDVYTTVNIQHIESLNNIVTQITGIVVRETIPDSILERAHSIELIDLPPEDLIKRLEEGKVYVPEEAGIAIEHFFKKSNLTALRELALRRTAEQVNTDVLLLRRGAAIENIWPTTERLLVCVGSDKNGAKLVRSAARMAKSLHADWYAVSIETPRIRMSDEGHHNIVQHLQRAEQLGGKTLELSGEDIADEIIKLAQDRNITKIILGKRPKSRLKALFTSSLADELMRRTSDIDFYILRGGSEELKSSKRIPQKSTPLFPYLFSILVVTLCSTVNFLLYKYTDFSTLVMCYFLGVLFIASLGYFGPSLATVILSALAFDFFFIPPSFSLKVANSYYLIPIVSMLIVSQVIAYLTLRHHQQAEFSRIREWRLSTLHLLSKQLANTRGVKPLLEIAVHYISDVFDCNVLALLPNQNRVVHPISLNHTKSIVSEKDLSVAQWVFDLGQIAGLGTQTLPDNEAIYMPLLGNRGPVGVLRILPKEPKLSPTPEQIHLLESICNQIAMALEVDRLQEEATNKELERENDRVRNVLLKYISDNTHAPLLDILDAAKNLINIGNTLASAPIQELGSIIYNNSEELNHLINNLSQIARLDSTEVTPAKKLHSLDKILEAALHSLNRLLKHRTVHIAFPADLPKIYLNRVFIEQVFFHIIENATKYTPEGTSIEISAKQEKEVVLVSIEDFGPGVALEEINKIFEKFYRGQKISHIKGMGLGLTICQRIITLHGGLIWAENRTEGGAVFYFTLPI